MISLNEFLVKKHVEKSNDRLIIYKSYKMNYRKLDNYDESSFGKGDITEDDLIKCMQKLYDNWNNGLIYKPLVKDLHTKLPENISNTYILTRGKSDNFKELYGDTVADQFPPSVINNMKCFLCIRTMLQTEPKELYILL